MMKANRVLAFCLAVVLGSTCTACSVDPSDGADGGGTSPSGLVSFDSGTLPGFESDGRAGDGGTDVPTSDASDSGAGDEKQYGEAPTGDTYSKSPVHGDVSLIPEVEVPSGVDVDATDVRQAIADVAPDVAFPSDVSVSSVSSNSVETDRGTVTTSMWRYSFGRGDAIVVAQVKATVLEGGSESEVVASVDSLVSATFDKADKSNVTDTKVDRAAEGISLSGGSIKCAAVSDGVYGVEIGFVADGKDLDASDALPTLTINGVTLVAQRREGDSTTHDGSERASFCYSGDIPCADGNVSVEWCQGKSSENGRDFVAASTSNAGARISFGSGTDDDVALCIAKAVSGRVALCHMSAQEAAGDVS